jgi:hypothetical protein
MLCTYSGTSEVSVLQVSSRANRRYILSIYDLLRSYVHWNLVELQVPVAVCAVPISAKAWKARTYHSG